MPHCIAISWVRNEADIIEAWVRHNTQYCDHMMITVHQSEDNTLEILEQLCDEGLSISLHRNSERFYNQGAVLTQCMRNAVSAYGPSWIMPLDADEFLLSTSGKNVPSILADLPQDRVALLPWKTYVPTVNDSGDEPHILKRIQHRRVQESPQYCKILIPPQIAAKDHIEIPLGSHTLQDTITKESVTAQETSDLALAHFPVRSANQVRTKVFGGWLSHLANPEAKPGQIFQWKRLFDQLKDGNELSTEELTTLSLQYASTEHDIHTTSAMVCDPITDSCTSIHYEQRLANPWKVLADAAESHVDASTSRTYSPTTGTYTRRIAEELAKATTLLRTEVLEPALRDGRNAVLTTLCDSLFASEVEPAGETIAEMLTLLLFTIRLIKGPNFDVVDTWTLSDAMPYPYLLLPELFMQEGNASIAGTPLENIIRTLRAVDTDVLEQECTAASNMDTFTHFYEAFLAAYKAADRNWHCAFYTPKPLTEYAVRSTQELLSTTMHIDKGFGGEQVHVLEVASGAGLLLVEALEKALQDNTHKESFRIPSQFGSIELMHTPYLLMHLRAAYLLKQHRVPARDALSLCSHVGDVYSNPEIVDTCFPHFSKDHPLVILSNPPYNQFSSAKFPEGASAAQCLARYRKPIEDTGLDTQPLEADYVKFTALIHDALKYTEKGIASLILRNAWLHSHTHLGMRKALWEDFDQLYILNLRGDVADRLQDPKHPDDENVYSTMAGHDMGICMLFLVRDPTLLKGVYYADILGSREEKYQFLSSHTVLQTEWTSLTPKPPYYLFVPAPVHAQETSHPADQEMQELAPILSPLHDIPEDILR